MGRYFLNSLTLNDMGIRLLPDEDMAIAVELEGGLTEELEQNHATVVLTTRRLIRYSAAGHKTNVVSAALDDVDSIEVVKTSRNRQWAVVAGVFILGGITLGVISLIFASYLISPLLMALSLTLIGVVFLIAYKNGLSGEVIVRAGVKDIKCKMNTRALDDMTMFVQRYYELKLGNGQISRDYEDVDIPDDLAEGHDEVEPEQP